MTGSTTTDRAATVRPPRLLQPAPTAAVRVAIVVVAAFGLGAATSFGQLLLPPEFAPLANSASGWAMPTALLVFVVARGYGEAAIGGALAFVALTIGYAVASGWRGIVFDPVTWAVIGLLTGPVVGTAAHAVRRPVRPAAIGAGVLAGILVGEGVYGLTVVADTTSPVYWWIAIALGAALVTAVAVRIRSVGAAVSMVVVTAGVAAAFVAAFMALPVLFGSL